MGAGILTPSFLFDVESGMKIVSSNEYERLNKPGVLWWTKVAREQTSTSKRDRLIWLLDSAKIEYVSKGGAEVTFEEILSNTTEYEARPATAGLELNRFQLEDHDGGGIHAANHWARQMGAYGAYWPQKQVAAAIRDNGLTYDGKAMFAVDHPLNPFATELGVYVNDFTGAATPGVTPGACPIDTSVNLETAFNNLAKAIAFVQGNYKMPNGEDPRLLKVVGIVVPSALVPRAQQLTNAAYIAQAATGGAGSADIEAVVRNWGLGQPIEAPELGAAFGGSDTTYYLLTEALGDEVGALVYINREPFSIIYNDQMSDAELNRANMLQWVTRGRNVVGYGHPYRLIRVRGS